MNTNDRGQNLAESIPFRREWATASTRPVHGGRPDPRCACAGTGFVHIDGQVTSCSEHHHTARGAGSEPPSVDWEGVAGRALADLQATANELKRLRGHMPADALREYDRRHHAGA